MNLPSLGQNAVIVTGIEQGAEVTNACWEEGGAAFTVTTETAWRPTLGHRGCILGHPYRRRSKGRPL